MGTASEVLAAANHLVACYGHGNIEGYLACFDPQATFDFYISDTSYESLAEWEQALRQWLAGGNRVKRCHSADRRVQIANADAGIFRHNVTTVIVDAYGTEETLLERETIVFALRSGRWVAIHEHLSPMPKPAAPDRDVVVSRDGNIRIDEKVIGQVPDLSNKPAGL